MLFTGIIVTVAAALAGLAVTFWVYRSAHRIGVIAEVNERSSHTHPTPSGGGVGIVAGGSIGAVLAIWTTPWPYALVAILALAIALIGFLDDQRGLSVKVRLPAQLFIAGAMVATLPLDALSAAIGLPLPSLVTAAVALIAAVYWINIFNFMDGIDGIAASEAIFILIGSVTLALLHGATFGDALIWWLIAIAAATLAFLALNWPPARIFMGDAGSTYLGFMIAFGAFATLALGWLSLWQWLVLVALFLADATLTLVRRALRREPIFKAHRLHAYQHLSRRWGHRPVTMLSIGVNVFALWPLAWVAGSTGTGAPVALGTYSVLVALLLWAGSGAPEKRA